MQPLLCAAGVAGPALGAAAGLGKWFVGVAVYRCVEFARGGGSTQQPQRIEPCQCVGGQPRVRHKALQGQMQPLLCAAGVVGPALGAAAVGSCRWLVGGPVLPVCGAVQRRRQHSAITAHRALPVCEWPALSMPWGTARSNAASTVFSRVGWACYGACGRGAVQVVCGGCGFAGLWRFLEEEVALGNHSAQSPASVWVASPQHAMGHFEVKCSLCIVK